MNDTELMTRAASWLSGAVTTARVQRQSVLVLPLATAERLADALVAALNREAA